MSAVQLSILLPTHRTGLSAISRIAQVCSWAGPDVEVIVRDNSGDAEKREIISRFQGDNCRVITAEPCEPLENFSQVLQAARGEFIFSPADDDLAFDRAIEALPGILKQFGGDPSVAGVAGHVVIEASSGSTLAHYADIDSDDAVARVTGYLNYGGPNVLLLSAMRRELYQRIMSFMNEMPIFLSFHDQVQSVLFLLSGKFIQLPRLMYVYDIGPWEQRQTAQQRDLAFCTAAGLDPVVNTLHWLMCAFEGAVLIRNADIFLDYPLAQRQTMADRWFTTKFNGFVHDNRSTFDSKFEDPTPMIRARLLGTSGTLSFESMLTEICNVLRLFSPEKAEQYFRFWNAQINQNVTARRQFGEAVTGSAA